MLLLMLKKVTIIKKQGNHRKLHPHSTNNDEYFLVFIVYQNLVVIDAVVMVLVLSSHHLQIHMTYHGPIMWKHDIAHKYITYHFSESDQATAKVTNHKSGEIQPYGPENFLWFRHTYHNTLHSYQGLSNKQNKIYSPFGNFCRAG